MKIYQTVGITLDAEFSGSMRNSNLIRSNLSVSKPSTLSIFFNFEKNEWGFLQSEGGKVVEDFETLFIAIVQID
jgi:hypothetical protein